MLFDGKKIEFVLLEKLKGVDTKGWIFFAAAAVLAAALIIFLVQRRKKCTEPAASTGNPTPTVILVHGALCIAISFVLSYFKLFSMRLHNPCKHAAADGLFQSLRRKIRRYGGRCLRLPSVYPEARNDALDSDAR